MPASPSLDHIPNVPTLPVLGHTLEILRDTYGLTRRSVAAHGSLYKVSLFGKWRVTFASADGVEYILTDPDKLFSIEGGWDMLSSLFPGGLMLRDFDDHRTHRRIMQAAFRKPAMDSYLEMMAPHLDRMVADWPAGTPFRFFPAIKELTLRMGAHVFMGLPVDAPEAAALNRAFIDEVAASMTPIRKPLPFTGFRRGIKARENLVARFRRLVEQRRGAAGEDFFSQMCRATDEEGRAWSDEEIVDHFNFLMMAAHDTTASGLTTMAWGLAQHPEWQERLIEEVDALGDGPMTPEMLAEMPLTDRVFKEALRLVPPVPMIPRLALRDFEWQGTRIPAGTQVTAAAGYVMVSPEHYSDPDRFDPDRFSPNRAEDRRHRFAWAPFGGGAHKCIGLHFSTIQVKVFTRSLLSRHRVALAEPGEVWWKRVPIPQPKGGLPVVLSPR